MEINLQVQNTAVTSSSRSTGLDLARVFAILFVIGGHFFIHTPLFQTPVDTPSVFIQSALQMLCVTNVPLFLIITGYLNINKKISRKYFNGIWSVLLSYIFISLITIGFRIHYLGEHKSLIEWVNSITSFNAIAYGWYIEMWIGLFLLTPFLNILWNNINTSEGRRNKHILILILYLICGLPPIFNRYGLSLVPNYWANLYPILFYFIGAYIREYQPSPKSTHLILIILGICMINPLFNIIFASHHSLIRIAGDGNGIFGIPLATAVFLLVYRYTTNNVFVSKISEIISKRSLDMYLVSFIFDIIFYQYFKEQYYSTQSQFGIYWIIIVPIVFLSSLIFAQSKYIIFRVLRLPTK